MCCSFIIPEECIVSNITEILFFFYMAYARQRHISKVYNTSTL